MLRVGSFLMMILLSTPLLRDCCLPVTHSLPCHESKHADDVSCASNQQAIVETKAGAAARFSIEDALPVMNLAASGIRLGGIRTAEDVFDFVCPPLTEIYLRTGTLLI